MLLRAALVTAWLASALAAQTATAADPLLAALARHAEAFAAKARMAITEETLVQRSYGYPPQKFITIGEPGELIRAYYRVHEVVSEYSIGRLKGRPETGALLEARAILTKDGKAIQTRESAQKRLGADLASGDDRVRKKILEELTALGLADVATDYGLILLAFTGAGQADLTITRAGTEWVGAEEAAVFEWRQERGGALEFRGRKAARRPLAGRIWVRLSDGFPLRAAAVMEHPESTRRLRDDASVDFILAPFGCAVPASAVHRHWVDGQMLTENLYTYAPFRLFTTDTRIEFGAPVTPR